MGGSTAAGLTAGWEHGGGDGRWCGPMAAGARRWSGRASAGAHRWSGRASAGARRWSGRTTVGAADLGGLCSIWGIWAAAVGWLTGRPTRSALELVGLGSPRVRGDGWAHDGQIHDFSVF